jgi:HEAT repeat protein
MVSSAAPNVRVAGAADESPQAVLPKRPTRKKNDRFAMTHESDSEIASELLGRLSHPDSIERGRAAEALGQLGESRHAPAIKPLLSDVDAIVAFKAAVALAWLGDDGGVDLLLKALAKPDLCFISLQALSHLASPRSRNGLKRFFKRRFLHPLERLQVAAALVRLGDDEAGEHIRKCLDSRRPEERGFALQLWGRLAMPGALDLLQSVLLDQQDDQRLDAIRGLAELGDAKALPLLERVARERNDPELTAEARAAAAVLKDQP